MASLYLSYDGDGCGKKVGRAVINNDEDGLREISAKIDLGHEIVKHWVAERGGKVISGGGDEGSFKIPREAIGYIEQLRKDYELATGITISVGVGSSLSEAGRSLLAAKFRGKDQVVYYDENVEKDIRGARERVKKGKASQEEYKLSEAYLEKSENQQTQQECQYCNESDGVDPDHCKYCHDAEQAQGLDDCPYCKQAETQDDCPYCKEAEQGTNDCPYCKDMGSTAVDPNSEEAKERAQYEAMGMNPPAIAKPKVGDEAAAQGLGQANPSDAGGQPMSASGEQNEKGKEIPQEGAHSKEALESIAEEIAGQTPEGKPEEKQIAENTDEADLAGNTEMEGNVSRPPGFENGTPGDMGMGGPNKVEGDNSPDFSEILQEDLNNNAPNIHREKAVQVVSQALESIKASKAFIEQARQQSPQLYASSIGMIKAMIEMAKMLGLGDPAGMSSEGENEWANTFATHPDQGGTARPGHAPSQSQPQPQGGQEGEGFIGQPIGKLSAKQTTKHVARTPLPPGSINAKGQQKVIDPKTGKTRFIDRKEGKVQSPTGVPVKAPGRGSEEDEPKN